LLPRRFKEAILRRLFAEAFARERERALKSARPKPEMPKGPGWSRSEAPGPKKPVRVAFGGAGRYAQHHLKALTAYENVEVTTLLTTGGTRGVETAEEYGIRRQLTDLDAFAALEDIDCFVLAISIEAMHHVASACLASGRPVLIEKPPGVTSAQTEELIAVARKAGTWGMVAMNRRFYSVVEHGLAALADLGPVRAAMLEIPQPITSDRMSRRLTEFDYDHYYVRNSIHGVDLLRYVLGEPRRVHAFPWANAEYGNRAASFAAVVEFGDGVSATVMDAWDTPSVWRLKVVAEQGWVEWEPFERGWVADSRGTKYPIRVDDVDVSFRPGIWAQDLHFVEAVRAGRRPPLPASTLEDALKTMQLSEAITAGL
jgi:predicted dehydrogenase